MPDQSSHDDCVRKQGRVVNDARLEGCLSGILLYRFETLEQILRLFDGRILAEHLESHEHQLAVSGDGEWRVRLIETSCDTSAVFR